MSTKTIMIMLMLMIVAPVMAGTIYEWKDPATGALKAGDKPPTGGVEYWPEGKRPKDRGIVEQKEPEKKAEPEFRSVLEQKDAEKKAAQDKIDAEQKAEQESARIAKLRKEMSEFIEKNCDHINANRVRIGMDKATFRTCIGVSPSSVNTTQTAKGTLEQWVYAGGMYFYFTNGILTAIQE